MKPLIAFFELYFDPLYRGPLLGTILMSFSTALIGALMFVRKKSLVGETISHATFPGVAIGVLVGSYFSYHQDELGFLSVILGAFVFGLLGFYSVELMIKNQKKTDSALCFVLSSFLSLGVLLTSYVQQTHVSWYRKIQVFFYGQSATMTDFHVWIYASLSIATLILVFVYFRGIGLISFDPSYAKSLGLKTKGIEHMIIFLFVTSIVVGIRSVGIVLITGMLLSPSIAARGFTKKFSSFVFLASLLGLIVSAFANYISLFEIEAIGHKSIPAGPLSVVIASFVAVLSLIFSPIHGTFFTLLRRWKYQRSCIEENILKFLWKSSESKVSFLAIREKNLADLMILCYSLYRLMWQGFIVKESSLFSLTHDGKKKADYIIRLHRLWELYLIEFLSSEIEKVHKSAEEIEHLITPSLEKKLTEVLFNPGQDPHHQPIPPKDYL